MRIRQLHPDWDAWQWDESRATLKETGASLGSCSGHVDRPDWCELLRIRTDAGTVSVDIGDWILKDDEGGLHVVTDEQFQYSYRVLKPQPADDGKAPWLTSIDEVDTASNESLRRALLTPDGRGKELKAAALHRLCERAAREEV